MMRLLQRSVHNGRIAFRTSKPFTPSSGRRTGHAILEEVARYTKAAEQKKLARAAIERLLKAADPIKIPNPSPGLGNGGGIPNSFNANSGEWRPRQDLNL